MNINNTTSDNTELKLLVYKDHAKIIPVTSY